MAVARRLPGYSAKELRELRLPFMDYKRCRFCDRYFKKGLGFASHERSELKRRGLFVPRRR